MYSQNVKSLLSTLLCVATLFMSLSVAVALPADASPATHSKDFRLRSRSLTAPKAFDGLYITTYHIGAAINWAVLVQKSEDLQGIALELNGTKKEFQHNQATLIFPVRPQGFAWPWIVETVTEADGKIDYPVQISAQEGTKGMFIDQGVLKYFNPLSGGWYACNNNIEYGSAVRVFWKVKTNTTPNGCEDIELVAEYV